MYAPGLPTLNIGLHADWFISEIEARGPMRDLPPACMASARRMFGTVELLAKDANSHIPGIYNDRQPASSMPFGEMVFKERGQLDEL